MQVSQKIAAAAFVLLSRTSLASLSSLQSLYEAMSSNITTLPGSSRTIHGIQLQMENLQEYGCWCYFDELHGLGKGPVQNGFDAACKALHQGITCASLDFPECDANSQVYDAKIRPDPEIPGNVVVDCEAFNGGDECAIATCYMESHFITLLMAESLEKENTPQYDLFSQSEGFDRKSCHGSKGPREHDNICCGQYFANTRRPVPVYAGDGDKQCCEDRVSRKEVNKAPTGKPSGSGLFQEEDKLVKAHRTHIDEYMVLIKQDMQLLKNFDHKMTVNTEDYVRKLKDLLQQKMKSTEDLWSTLLNFDDQ